MFYNEYENNIVESFKFYYSKTLSKYYIVCDEDKTNFLQYFIKASAVHYE